MGKMSWEERRKRLAGRTKRSAENREGKASNVLTFKNLPEDKEVRWADKPKKDRQLNKYDILPFEITMDWYRNMRTAFGKPTELEVGDVDYKLEFAQHNNVGPEKTQVLCLTETFGKPCPVCEERARLRDDPDEDPEGKISEEIKPKWRTLYNIIDLNGDDEIRLFHCSYHLFEKELLEKVSLGDEGLQYHWDLKEGKTVIWRGKEKTWGGRTFIDAKDIVFEDRDPFEEDILDEVYPLDQMLVIPTYEDVVGTMTGMVDDDSSTSGDGDNTSSKPKDRGRTRGSGSRYKKGPKETEPEDPPDDPETKGDTGDAPWDECPDGLTFGVDFDTKDECQTCPNDSYDACQEESERLVKMEEEKKKRPQRSSRRREKKDDDAGDSTTTRTRRRRSNRR
jgi:hypothetical protein